jgi:transformation/transcription domain-associated protein
MSRQVAANPPATPSSSGDPHKRVDSDQSMKDGTSEAEINKEPTGNDFAGAVQPSLPGPQSHADVHVPEPQRSVPPTTHSTAEVISAYPIRQPWEYIEEVVQILKTANPLLIMSMETMFEQINHRFKATPEEDIYRLICMLLQDAIQVSIVNETVMLISISYGFRLMSSV